MNINMKEKIGGFAMNQAINYISGNPETNIPKLLNWIDALGI